MIHTGRNPPKRGPDGVLSAGASLFTRAFVARRIRLLLECVRSSYEFSGRRNREIDANDSTEVGSDAAQTVQFAVPRLCFQSLITPGGNSRLPTPVRRQASGHISSKERSSRNRALWEP